MIDSILNFQFNSLLGVLLYWLPMGVCAVGYIARTWDNYRRDVSNRSKSESESGWYVPTDTLGSVIGRGLASVIPVANLIACIFDVAPGMLGGFFRWIGKVFDQPLVPKRK